MREIWIVESRRKDEDFLPHQVLAEGNQDGAFPLARSVTIQYETEAAAEAEAERLRLQFPNMEFRVNHASNA